MEIELDNKHGGKGNNRLYLSLLIGKIAFIWCLVIFTAGYLTSNTTAHFNDKLQVSDQGNIGVWEKESEEPEPTEDNEQWDKYSLQFVSKQTQNLTGCKPVVIKAKLKNTSDTPMTETIPYAVYYVENGNPQNKHGEKLALSENEGIIPALKAGEIITLTFTANNPGSYMFRAGSPDEEGIWSEKVMLKCKEKKEPKSNENNKKEQEESVEKQASKKVKEEDKANAEQKRQVSELTPNENEEVVEAQEEERSKNEMEDPETNDSSNKSEAGKE